MKTRVRQLANGKWVAEVKRWFGCWQAIDNGLSPYYGSWPTGYYHYAFLDTKEEAEKVEAYYNASHGI